MGHIILAARIAAVQSQAGIPGSQHDLAPGIDDGAAYSPASRAMAKKALLICVTGRQAK
jgi:hypothetical protein